MSGLIKTVFGGSSSKQQSKQDSQSTQESGNLFANQINDLFNPVAKMAGEGGSALRALLGLGGDGEQAAAQANFRNTPGYQFQMDEGVRALDNSAAGRGVLGSGAAMKSVQKFGSNLADTTYNNYLDKLLASLSGGTAAGQLIGNAGQYSKGQSTSTGTSSGSSSSFSGNFGKALGFG